MSFAIRYVEKKTGYHDDGPAYLKITKAKDLDPHQFTVVDIDEVYPVQRILYLENEKKDNR